MAAGDRASPVFSLPFGKKLTNSLEDSAGKDGAKGEDNGKICNCFGSGNDQFQMYSV